MCISNKAPLESMQNALSQLFVKLTMMPLIGESSDFYIF